MTDQDWADSERRVIQMLLDGQAIPDVDPHGERIVGQTLLLVFNAGNEATAVTLPRQDGPASRWERVIDTAHPSGPSHVLTGGNIWTMAAKSAAAFRLGR